MNNAVATIDLPKGLMLSDIEVEILRGVVSGKRTKVISQDLGIPQASILTLIKKDKVKITAKPSSSTTSNIIGFGLTTIVPVLLIGGLLFWMMRSAQGQGLLLPWTVVLPC